MRKSMSIPEIVTTQNAFFKAQHTKTIQYRLSVLKAIKTELLKAEDTVYAALHKDFKKSKFETYISEFGIVISELNHAIKHLKKWSKPTRVKSNLLTFPSKDYIHKTPYGTVLVIAPWNYPLLLALEPLIMAIAAGNTVVLKPSELTPNTSQCLHTIITKTCPPALAICVQGGVSIATELLAQKWDYIFFTGSTKVGKIVAQAAAKHLTPVTLELGGKSPCIIDDTINLNLVTRRLVWGKLLNGGQTCIAPDYILVKTTMKAQLIAALKTEITNAYSNTPQQSPDYPRIISNKHLKRLQELIANETVCFGGTVDLADNYMAPTLIDASNLNSPLMTEEIFGPILPILSYDTAEDLEDIITNLERPLAFYIFSKNKTFVKDTLQHYTFGGAVVNDVLVHFGNSNLPFGGVGYSGMGRYHGKYGFDTFSHEYAVLKRGTWIDPPFRYAPYKGKLGLIQKAFKYFG